MDKIREEFEKTELYKIGSAWVKWNGDIYVKYCNGMNRTAASWAVSLTAQLELFTAGYKSRDKEIISLNEQHTRDLQVIVIQQDEIKKLKEGHAVKIDLGKNC